MERERVVLHVDCDEFFLQVHERADDRVAEEIRDRPCALWQYNDVICANAAAKRAGVKKHQSPQEARALLEPLGGRMLHAFWRTWPGQRVVYTPYQAAGRQVLDSIEAFLQASHPSCKFVVERTSVDECYIDCSEMGAGGAGRGETLAHRLKQHILDTNRIRVSVGVSFNRLLAKLASAQAKKDPSAHGVKVVGQESCLEFLGMVPATKLPGLGQKTSEVARLLELTSGSPARPDSVLQLQRFSPQELRQHLNLKSDAVADTIWQQCRGCCSQAILPASPPKSLVVTSWLAGARLGDLARTEHLGRGGGAVVVGGGEWVFEPHHLGEAKTNRTRPRWILLALALDLSERIVEHRTAHAELPTAITAGFHQPARTGHWHDKGRGHSKTQRLPPSLVALLESAKATDAWSGQTGREAAPLQVSGSDIAPLHSVLECTPLSAETVGHDGDRRQCVGGIVDAAAAVLQALVTEHGPDTALSQLTLSAVNFRPIRAHGSAGTGTLDGWLRRAADCSHKEPARTPPLPACGAGAKRHVTPDPSPEEAAPPGRPEKRQKREAEWERSAGFGVDLEAWGALPREVQAELGRGAGRAQAMLLAGLRAEQRQRAARIDSYFSPYRRQHPGKGGTGLTHTA